MRGAVKLQHQMKSRTKTVHPPTGLLSWTGKRNKFKAVFPRMYIKCDDMVTSIASLEICFRRCCLQVGETSRNCKCFKLAVEL